MEILLYEYQLNLTGISYDYFNLDADLIRVVSVLF